MPAAPWLATETDGFQKDKPSASFRVALVSHHAALALEVLAHAPSGPPTPTSIGERITAAVTAATQPLSISELRPLRRVRNSNHSLYNTRRKHWREVHQVAYACSPPLTLLEAVREQ